MKTTRRYIYLILFIGLALRLYFLFGNHYISPDGTHYARLGYHVFHDFRYMSGGSQFPDIIQPPLYPLAAGFFTLFFSPEYAGKIASLIFGLLLIWAVFRFTLQISGRESLAQAAALTVALNPALIAVSSQVATEALFLLLLFVLYALVLRYFHRSSFKLLGWGGIVTGLACLTRPESLLYFAGVVVILLLWRRPLRHILGYLGIGLLFIGMYSFWSSQQLGYRTLYPKLGFVRAQGTVSRYFLRMDRARGVQVPAEIHRERFRYALSPDKKEIAVNAIFFKHAGMQTFFDGQKKIPTKARLRMAFGHWMQNSVLALKKFLNGLAFPWVYWIFLLAGLWKFPFKKWKNEIIGSFIFLLPIGAIIFSNVEQRFFYIVPIVLAPVLARGLLQLVAAINPNKKRHVGWIVTFLLLFLGMIPGYAENWQKTQSKNYYFAAGRWLKSQVRPKEKVAAAVPQAVFFADRPYCPLPFAPLDSLELYLRGKEVDYILIENRDLQKRPGLLNLNRLPPFLKKESKIRIKNHHFILLRVMKEKAHERQNAKH